MIEKVSEAHSFPEAGMGFPLHGDTVLGLAVL